MNLYRLRSWAPIWLPAFLVVAATFAVLLLALNFAASPVEASSAACLFS
jgi:hypothetical protein